MNCYWMLLYLCVSSKKHTFIFSIQWNKFDGKWSFGFRRSVYFCWWFLEREPPNHRKSIKITKKSSNIFEHSRKYLTRLWFPRCAGCEKTASHSPHCRSNWAHWSAACCRNDLRKEKPSLVNLIDNRLSTKTKRQTY